MNDSNPPFYVGEKVTTRSLPNVVWTIETITFVHGSGWRVFLKDFGSDYSANLFVKAQKKAGFVLNDE